MDILERAHELEKEGHHVIHLEVGEPDFPTPQPIVQAAIDALQMGKTSYTHSMGLSELRLAIAGHYESKYQLKISPDQVLVCSGTSPAMLLAFQTMLEDDQEFIIANPYYSCYPNFIRGAGGKAVTVDITEDDGFDYNIDRVKKAITNKTRGILVNSPANPTGVVSTKEKLEAIAGLGLPYILSDEIYHGLTYSDKNPEHSILEFTDRAIVVNGFSKLYAMTGWRLGYLIAPPDIIRAIQRLQQNYFISANNFVQWAGITALTGLSDELTVMRETYNKRRQYMISRLRELGFTIKVEPEGAFYVFANARAFTDDSKSFAFRLLEEEHIGVTPGIDFGSGGEGYIRFSYANSLSNIEEALNRLEGFLKKIRR